MLIQQLSIFVENKPGRMAEVTGIIGDAGVDIRALSIADTSDFGILRLIVNKPQEAVHALRAADVTVSLTDVVAVGVPDKPGAFAKAVKVVSDAGISIEYMYAFLSKVADQAFVILRMENPQAAIDALQQSGIQVLGPQDLYNL